MLLMSKILFVFGCVQPVWCLWSFWKLDDVWKRKSVLQDVELGGYFKDVTGRVFVTMFGYPSRCQRKGFSHACTLSVACWWVGGSSQSGCGASPWIVACCVKHIKKKDEEELYDMDYSENEIQIKDKSVMAPMERRNGLFDIEDDNCGISNDRIMQKRIVGGKEARFGQFPWQAYIKVSNYQCGGVIAKLSDILVYLGELDTEDSRKIEEPQPAELHRVKKLLIHPKFEYKATQPDRFDLALLELVTEAGFNFHISSICLPDKNIKLTARDAVVAGWGKVNPWDKVMGTNILRSVAVPILDIRECRAWHKIKQIDVDLHSEMICGGHKEGKRDACLGDSGGPLIVLEKGRWTLVGITSAGFGCGEAQQPGIYHKIPTTVDWIKTIIHNQL
ncbi:serine protease 27 isoform X2 [Sitophilus oryzae]|uniref:Serine protease 27 isoform X2 n=1 Tax=Sitophilus oryzae TaxID=7048 RepID=A0A6J2YK93_SITOR|nr:serine protease 27 isoform X2 [Sitophilus oryzae]